MSLNIKRGLAGAVLTALAAGAIALTAAAPASASTAAQAGPVVKAAVQGDRIQGPFVTSTVTSEYGAGSSLPTRWNEWTVQSSGALHSLFEYKTETLPYVPPTHMLEGEIWTFPAVGTTGPVMNSQEQCLVLVPATNATGNQQSVVLGDCSNAAVVSISADGAMQFNGSYMSDGDYPPNQPMVIFNTSVKYSATDALYLGAMTPVVAVEDCTDGLAASVSNVNQTAKSAVVSGTGAAGETITINGSPTGAVTTVVDASGNWTANIAGLATGDNTLTVTSSDNCAPVEVSVIIEELAIPVAHPAAAAAAGVLGLGALLLGGIRRRNTARI